MAADCRKLNKILAVLKQFENFAVNNSADPKREGIQLGLFLVLTALMPVGKHAGRLEVGPLNSASKKLVANNNYALAA